MEKITKHTKFPRGKMTSNMTNAFRKMVEKQLGPLDTATSFMYLFRKYGVPTYTNADEYKILYDYRFLHEDVVIVIHASYHSHVYFSISLPVKRFTEWEEDRRRFFQSLYKTNKDIPFMPYVMLPFEGNYHLTELQNKKNWALIEQASGKYFTPEQIKYIEDQFKGEAMEHECFQMLDNFGSSLHKDFVKRLTRSQRKKLYAHTPAIKDIPGLQKQCRAILRELKKGCYVRDVQINILGYESDTNIIKETDED